MTNKINDVIIDPKCCYRGCVDCETWNGKKMINESEFYDEFILTKEDMAVYYGVYSDEDLDRID